MIEFQFLRIDEHFYGKGHDQGGVKQPRWRAFNF